MRWLRVAHFMNKDKLKTLMKAFIESQFAYCPLIWMFHSRELNNKITKLHERALRLVYSDHISTFDELTDESLTVHHRIYILLLYSQELFMYFLGILRTYLLGFWVLGFKVLMSYS